MKKDNIWSNILNKLSAFKKESGFTITEMLVVISIIALLSSLALSYNKASERQIRLFRDQSTIVSVLNRAKSLSLQRFNEQAEGGISICAVGVRFPDSKNFHIFQDLVDPETETCDDSNLSYDSGEDVESFSLGDQIQFYGDAASGLEILFIPPHLGVTTTAAFPANIGVRTTDQGISTEISVSGAGQITTQEVQE